jgi:prepilin-type N-terminal cleavage/methylation domain-containing protein
LARVLKNIYITSLIKNNKGFSLLELLIAVCIFSLGLLEIASFEISSLNRVQDAYWKSLAISAVTTIIEQQKSNSKDCSNWQKYVVKLLPHAQGKCTANKISLCWQGKFVQRNCYIIKR